MVVPSDLEQDKIRNFLLRRRIVRFRVTKRSTDIIQHVW